MERLDSLELLDELGLELLELDGEELLLETELVEILDSLEELVEMELELVDTELLLDPELGLDTDVLLLELLELLWLDRSSIDRICNRSPLFGPGNWREPVWKFSTSMSLDSPVVL